MTVKYFEDLEVWKLAREVTNRVYSLTRKDAFSRDFGLVDQIRRAAVSVMSNIAEGFERGGNQEFIQFLFIAKASCGEARCQLHIALDQGYITEKEFNVLLESFKKLSITIHNFINYLRTSRFKGEKYRKQYKSMREEVTEMLKSLPEKPTD